MKRFIAIILMLCFIVGLFSACNKKTAEKQKFSETFIDYFDTVITVVGYEYTAAEFDAVSEAASSTEMSAAAASSFAISILKSIIYLQIIPIEKWTYSIYFSTGSAEIQGKAKT